MLNADGRLWVAHLESGVETTSLVVASAQAESRPLGTVAPVRGAVVNAEEPILLPPFRSGEGDDSNSLDSAG